MIIALVKPEFKLQNFKLQKNIFLRNFPKENTQQEMGLWNFDEPFLLRNFFFQKKIFFSWKSCCGFAFYGLKFFLLPEKILE